jgi:predicted amidophosphoribosyltransferase
VFSAYARADVLLDLLLPRRCAACGRIGDAFCGPCRAALPRLRGPCCARCGAPTAWPVRRCLECAGRRLAFASARAAVAYEGPVRPLVSAWKERGLRVLAHEAADVIANTVERPPAAALVFIPPDGDRSVKRGYHPAEQLAVELGRRWELPVARVLGRTRAPKRQRGLSLVERRLNVRGAFVAIGNVPARAVLLDDVYTTGSTASAAASALRRAGTRRVEVVTFARAVRTIESLHRS